MEKKRERTSRNCHRNHSRKDVREIKVKITTDLESPFVSGDKLSGDLHYKGFQKNKKKEDFGWLFWSLKKKKIFFFLKTQELATSLPMLAPPQ